MAFTIAPVQTTAAGAGAGVAIDRIGTTDFQQIKLIGGQTSATTGVEATTGLPDVNAVGIVVRQPGVTGRTTQGFFTGVHVWLAGSQTIYAAGVSMSGTTASFSDGLVNPLPLQWTTGAVSGAAPGHVVRVVDGPAVTVANVVGVSGTVSIAPTTLTVNTAPTVAGASVTAQVSGTVSVSGPVQVSGTVTIAPTTFTVNTAGTVNGASVTIQQGVAVTAVVSGTVNVGTVATILGTQIVSIAQTSVSVAAIPTVNTVVAVSGVTAVSVVSTIGTILGTQIVSVAQTSVSVATIPTVLTIVTQLGTQIVSIAQTSVSVAALPTVNTVITILGTQVVTLATGGSVAALDVGRTQVVIVLSATSVGISGTTLAFTVYTGVTQAGAGTTAYVVPAGKTLRILSGNMMARNSVTSSPATARLYVLVSTALPTWTSTVPIALQMAAACSSSSQAVTGGFYGVQDVGAGVTVGIAASIATSGATIDQAVVNGYLFP